jgi:hypothetical protein
MILRRLKNRLFDLLYLTVGVLIFVIVLTNGTFW